MRSLTRARKTAIAATTILFASLLTAGAASAATGTTAASGVNAPGVAAAAVTSTDLAASGAAALQAGATGARITTADASTGTVTGTITSSVAVEQPVVLLMVPAAKTGYHRWKTTSYAALADPDGRFVISGVKPGTYSAVFGDLKGTAAATRYYGNTDNVTKAKSFTVKAGATVSGIGTKLVAGVTVSGKVTTSRGTPITGATAMIARKISVDGKGFWEYAQVRTDAKGRYTVSGLAHGTLAVKVNGPSGAGYAAAFYGGGRSFESSKTFVLTSGQSKGGVNVTLTKKLTSATPKIVGTAKVGKKLTAKPGSWTKGTSFSYQWYANGKAIKKATKSTFVLKKAQKGKKITVKVVGKKTGYGAVSKTSKATKKVS